MIAPAALLDLDLRRTRELGLSSRKSDYIHSVARAFVDLPSTPDNWCGENGRNRMTALRGVGPWTADMVAIFALGELDILPVADIGLQRAVARYYGGEPGAASVMRTGEGWKPWRTVAVWYLWRDLDPVPVAY